MPDALTRCVGDGAAFLDTAWTARPHRAAWSGGFDDLLSLDDVDQVVASGTRTPAIRLVQDGDPIPSSRWTRSARVGAVRHDDVADAGKVFDLFAGGATVVLQSLQRWWPPLQHFCRELELTLGHAVQANAYLTPAGARGLAPHHDTHDVFVLQSHGSKRWLVREPLVEAPLKRHTSDHAEAAGQPVVLHAELTPGDALYLPRGWIHEATSQRDTSLHITVGVLATTAHDVVRLLLDRAADEDARFRRTTSSDPAAIAAIAADFADWLGKADIDGASAALDERFWSNRRPLLHGQLRQLTDLDRLDDTTIVRRRAGAVCRLRIEDERLVVLLGDRRLEMPSTLEAAVARLVDGEALAVGTLDRFMDEQSRRVLVRRLVKEGLLEAEHDRGA